MSGEPKIRSTPGVCGGAACIRTTRIPVWSLESYRRLGADDAELLRNYPSLTAEDLRNAWEYVAANREEIDREILEKEKAMEGDF